jgi:murein DD-endopeptidase MepM/ murein hydrolase activator NlpD
VIIAGIVVIALAAFNWEEIDIKMPDISSADFQEAFVFQPLTSAETENHTMRYAATGITSILPSINTNNTTTAAEIPDASNAVTNIEEIPQETDAQNDLITFQWQQYRVKKGDSVSVIAQRHGVSVGAIIASNEIRNARTLREGATIRIPNIDGIPYQIKTGDSLSKIAASFNVPLEVILDVNDIKSDIIKAGETIFIPGARMNDIDLRLSLGELFIYPVQSKYVTSRYGMRKDPINGALNFHTGIDLRANTGESVMAALDGVVSVVTENWLYGKYIILTHDNGYKTLYAHLHNFNVKQGDRVARGRKIGEAGNTGYSTGSHLHFGIYDKNNKLINPLDLLR